MRESLVGVGAGEPKGEVMHPDPTPESACLIVDPLPARRDYLHELLDPIVRRFGLSIVSVAAIGDRAVSRSIGSGQAFSMVLIVLDATDPSNPYAYQTVAAARRLLPDARILVLSDAREPTHDVLDAFRAGAHGFMESSTDPHLIGCALSLLMAGGVFYSGPSFCNVRSSPTQHSPQMSAS